MVMTIENPPALTEIFQISERQGDCYVLFPLVVIVPLRWEHRI